ncbi:Clp protease ClpP [Parabacteroides goldsteinii]|uniref:Clp protease ClpP n=2 Tax=Parabacteroides goldsteinii TaxID=328812 RepID=UPI00321C2D63
MPKNRIEINGTIDRWGYGSNYFRWQLKDCGEGPVTVSVNSYGGDVNEALAIGNQIAEHGNVTVEYVAFNASAATLLGLYAQKTTINSDALFMIHKTSVWVDTWGQMNEDQIDQAIENLKEQKDLASVTTLQLAKCYSEKSGKTIADILAMMKDARWLTPQEALDAGFVDEIIESKCKKKQKVSNCVAALFASNGTPLPEDRVGEEEIETSPKNFSIEEIANRVKSFLSKNQKNDTNLEQDPINKPIMNKQFTHLNQVLNIEGFDVQNNSVTLTVEQLNAFNTAIEEAEQTKTKHSTVLDGLNALDETVKDAKTEDEKLTAVKNLLNKRPGVLPSNQSGTDTHETTLDYVPDEINNYFNQQN